MDKKIICIDFDGVIHSYERGWQNGEVYGTVTPGFFEWATKAKEHFTLMIYSSRSKTAEGRGTMYHWLKNQWGQWAHGRDLADADIRYNDFEFSDVKPPAFLTIDDRAICFQGDWLTLDPAELSEFRPWNVYDQSTEGRFIADWDRVVAGVSAFATKYNMPKPQMIFSPQWLAQMNKISDIPMAPVIVYGGVKIRFGVFEQADVLRSA